MLDDDHDNNDTHFGWQSFGLVSTVAKSHKTQDILLVAKLYLFCAAVAATITVSSAVAAAAVAAACSLLLYA